MTEADRLQAAGTQINPGDDAPPGTPGTGEDICPECGGTGRLNDKPCPNCGGTGRINEGIGGG
jgi:rubrerythrin